MAFRFSFVALSIGLSLSGMHIIWTLLTCTKLSIFPTPSRFVRFRAECLPCQTSTNCGPSDDARSLSPERGEIKPLRITTHSHP